MDTYFEESFENAENAEVFVGLVFANNVFGKNVISDTEVKKHLAANPKFEGKRGQTLTYTTINDYSDEVLHIVLLGVGEPSALDEKTTELLAAPLLKALTATGREHAVIMTDTTEGMTLSREQFAASLINAVNLKSYCFDKYKTKANDDKPALQTLGAEVENPDEAERLYATLEAETKGVLIARDLANEPGNVLYPQSYADRIANKIFPSGSPVKVTILTDIEMEILGMGAALAVGQGSSKPPRMVVMEYNGADGSLKDQKPIALVGKGVTFDSGGISIKPGEAMDEMKYDMGGSAAVVGAMSAIAAQGANVRVVAIVGLAENMPDAGAYKPGDVVTSMNGQTIEVLNTDAEGRLVLADALTYIQTKYDPHTVIDAATLTGACVVALGHEFAGIFSNDDELAQKIEAAGKEVHEKTWRLPLSENFAKAVRGGKTGDLVNITGRYGGSIGAAEFLHAFIDDGRKWAHCDIAGTAWAQKNHPVMPDDIGSGYGARLLNRLVKSYEMQPAPVPEVKPADILHIQV